jgi:ADP-ribosylglycohydrolase
MPVQGALLQDRFRGCLLGQAIGDALGALVEAQEPAVVRALPQPGIATASCTGDCHADPRLDLC